MKLIFFLSTLFVCSYLFAQEQQDKVTTNLKKILIGVSVSPNYSYRTLSNNDGSISSNEILKTRNKTEKAKIGFTSGIDLVYNFSEKIGIGTGILFSNIGYQTNSTSTFFAISQNDPSIPKTAKFCYNYYYLDIPIKASMYFGKGKLKFITSAGITSNVLIKASTTSILEYADGSNKKSSQPSSEDFKKFNISPCISIGIEKQIKNRSFIRFEPSFNYGLLKIIDTPITAHLWNAGLNISYYFSIK